MRQNYLNLTEAAELAGVPERAMRRLIRRGELTLYTNPFDQRETLVRRDDINTLLGNIAQPRKGEALPRQAS